MVVYSDLNQASFTKNCVHPLTVLGGERPEVEQTAIGFNVDKD